MASLLYRLGRLSARRHKVVLSVWALLLAVVASLALGLEQSAPEDTSFSIPGTQASEGLDVVGEKFAGDSDAARATVVFAAPQGQTLTGANAAALQARLEELRGIDGVASVSDPLSPQAPMVSRDQRIASSTVVFTEDQGAVSEETQDTFTDATDTPARGDGAQVRVEMTSNDLAAASPSALSEVIGVAVALVVLVLTYGSLVAAGANLLTACVGVGLGFLGITALSKVVSLSSTTPALATMLGLAVGIDYALFVFARTRSELRAGREPREAVARATGTAGTAVVFAGATVIIALVGLSVVNIPFLTQMGLAAAATVAVAVLVALTAVPAALALMGRRVLPRSERATDGVTPRSDEPAGESADAPARAGTGAPARRGFFGRWSSVVTAHPVLALLGALVVVATIAVPFASIRTALPSAENADPASSSRQAYDLLVEGFGEGSQSTLLVLVNAPDAGDAAGLGAVAADVQDTITGLPDVVAVTPPAPSADGTAQLITVVPSSGPTDEATRQLVLDIRSATEDTSGAEVLVTGETALNIDVTDALADALPVYVGLIVVLALALLVMVFRSLLVPLLATVGFLLSLAASLGAATAIYQWGWLGGLFGVAQPGPLLSFMPVLVVGILFGLAMDYQLFLVSAMHEAHARGASATEAVAAGFARSAPVVVAAALIMSGVFVGFASSGDPIIGSIGTALTVGVLADAFVVRMVIVPAALTLLGERAWWMPRWMERVVPDVDSEGRGLERMLGGAPAAAGAPREDASGDRALVDAPGAAGDRALVDAAGDHGAAGAHGSGRAVVGTVTDAAGDPVVGAVLTATDHAGHQLSRTDVDDRGAYRLPLDRAGTVMVVVAALRTKPVAHVLVVTDGELRHDVVLVGTGTVTGHVRVPASWAPPRHAEASVDLLDAAGRVVATTSTSADGGYRLTDLLAGRYVLSVRSDAPGPLARPAVRAVEVADGRATVADVRLGGDGRLVGCVESAATGAPVAEAVVTLVDSGGSVVASVVTGRDGTYAFEDLEAGEYVVTASGYAPAATTVEVADGDLRVLEVPLGAHAPTAVTAAADEQAPAPHHR